MYRSDCCTDCLFWEEKSSPGFPATSRRRPLNILKLTGECWSSLAGLPWMDWHKKDLPSIRCFSLCGSMSVSQFIVILWRRYSLVPREDPSKRNAEGSVVSYRRGILLALQTVHLSLRYVKYFNSLQSVNNNAAAHGLKPSCFIIWFISHLKFVGQFIENETNCC